MPDNARTIKGTNQTFTPKDGHVPRHYEDNVQPEPSQGSPTEDLRKQVGEGLAD